jgi:hypothetical protein
MNNCCSLFIDAVQSDITWNKLCRKEIMSASLFTVTCGVSSVSAVDYVSHKINFKSSKACKI